jgi:hypothetical protein
MTCCDNWGTTPEERARTYACDAFLEDPVGTYYRAVSVDAPTPTVFRWLCQLRAAPYSYDWIDNGGRPSPRKLIPGLERLEIGQTFMTIFELAAFEPDRHVTLRLRRLSRFFGEIAITYEVAPGRLLAKMRVRYPAGLIGRIMRAILPCGDLIMMRKQLLTLKHLSQVRMINP